MIVGNLTKCKNNTKTNNNNDNKNNEHVKLKFKTCKITKRVSHLNLHFAKKIPFMKAS